MEKAAREEKVEEVEVVYYGNAMIDGIAVPSHALEKASEDYPVVLLHNHDCIPVKAGEKIYTPYDAVVSVEEVQVVGPMIRMIRTVAPLTNVEKPPNES